ncbi:STAS domain-containing protein [Haloechinothrix sp. LS1_15]|uniref:STAS domain-containing protein n=1 Tax=Haloechinothrix sp. LS1_15 TaxID=2652248 RepID=UPI0029469889|nr:STAS domain-containing protein [Haloechinothrix sp. LS1_15]MDV6014667.1 STAS domain-containing protein [Haloechinothrix sp. LS1_15]
MRGDTVDLSLEHPTPDAAVITATGVLDAETVPRLAEMLTPRLSCALDLVALDVSRTRFVGVAALRLALEADQRMRARGGTFCLVGGARSVDRALRAAEPACQLRHYPTVREALRRACSRGRHSAASPAATGDAAGERMVSS